MAVAAILVAAAGVRLIGIGFGLPYPYAAVDEHIVTDRAVLMTAGDWNPHYFAYPSLCFGLFAIVAFGVFAVGRMGGAWSSLAEFRTHHWLEPGTFLLASRVVAVALAVATVWAVGRLAAETARAWAADAAGAGGEREVEAERRDRRRAGLVASLALALSFLHAANSRWVSVDVPLVLFGALALAHSLKHLRRGTRRDLVFAALFTGLAASSKYYGALFALPVASAVVLRAVHRDASGRPWPVRTMHAGAGLLTA